MRILITNFVFHGRTGSEVATAELAIGLVRRGHSVAVYSPLIGGATADDARRCGVVVVDALSDLRWQPDVIHGHHNIVLAAALLWFPRVPALLVSHHPSFWIEGGLAVPQVKRVFAVSELSRARMATESGLAPADVGLLLNAVDLDRFRQQRVLPETPRKALVLTKNSGHIDIVREVAASAGLDLDTLGRGVDVVVDDLHARLHRYDLVFSTGRMALEALASGCAVILVDERGLGGLVTRDVVASWRSHNLGQHLLQRTLSARALRKDIARFDASDARGVSDYIRQTASLDGYLDTVEQAYRDITADGAPGLARDRRATARLYERVMRHMAARRQWWQSLPDLAADTGATVDANVARQRELAYERQIAELDKNLAVAEADREHYRLIMSSTSWRVTAPARRLAAWMRARKRRGPHP